MTGDGARLRPVAPGERIELLDVLRGFALAGVLLVNLTDSAVDFLTSVLASAELDAIFGTLTRHLVTNKAYTVFCLLFGLGLAVQMARAKERGVSLVPTYSRRLAWLLAFGIGHIVFLWWGDVLAIYALAGFVLLALRNCSDRTLLLLGGAGYLLTSGVFFTLRSIRAQHAAGSPEPAAELSELAAGVADGGYADAFANNLAIWREGVPSTIGYTFLWSVAIFLLGYWAGRGRYLQDASRHLPFFRRLLRWGLFAGLVGAVARALLLSGRIEVVSPWYVPSMLLREIGDFGLASTYVSAIVLLFHQPAGKRLLSWLAPIGRMALTNYLSHSVFFLLIFSGLGLGWAGKISYAACVPIAAAIFAFQAVASHFWLRFFRFGPMEWLWRSLTYGKRQRFLA